MIRKISLVCGILASLVYVGADIIAAMSWEGYSYMDQTRSELSALGAPTRDFMVVALNLQTVLVLVFAVEVWLIVAAVAVANSGHLARPGRPRANIGSAQLTPR